MADVTESTPTGLDVGELRQAIREEYALVAREPDRGFHFHTGRPLAAILGYEEQWLQGLPETAVAAFAGTGSPFAMGMPAPGEQVIDIGSGGGIDSLIAGRSVGGTGRVVGVDMTPEMLDRARAAAAESSADNVEFVEGVMESLPVEDGWADLIISNGVFNLAPDKTGVLGEMHRALRPGGRLQIADILVAVPVSESAKAKIDLWTG